MKSPNELKYNFGKNYHKPISPFKKYWNGGVGSETMLRSHIAEDAWNNVLYLAVEKLRDYGINEAYEILENLFEEEQ